MTAIRISPVELFLGQPCNKSDIPVKLVDDLLARLVQDLRFLRMYIKLGTSNTVEKFSGGEGTHSE